MNKINFCLIGCGRISSRHLDALKLIDSANVLACCDIVTELAEDTAKKYNIKNFYTNYKEMLEIEQPNAVIICTPSGLHSEMGIFAAEHHINVITEKPVSISLKQADSLIKACDNNKVKLFVVKQNRLNQPIQLLKNAIDKGRFGKIFSVNSTVRWTRPQSYYDLSKWRGTWEFDGGAFLNQASHYFDLLYWLIGPVDYVMATTATLNHNIEVEDLGAGIIRFRNGVIGVIEVTMNIFPRNLEGSITVMGEYGTAKIGGIAVNKVEHWEFKDYDDDDRFIDNLNTKPLDVYGYGHLGFLSNVVEVLLGKAEPKTDGRDGRKSLEIILAMYESAKIGKRVSLPFNP
ncbi:MAG: Gfo/Idh/MocA family oxidoreductase [Candidatus Cloacimonetes bacterium]|nr:Gfo/Idh/MocA family oxidoreductase [Candidatus Cloacimonadota bacterium]MDD4155770.1 Gfo/Idh/MocA family oxidoreductase [Candidatus Cloacimonadota bacterium]